MFYRKYVYLVIPKVEKQILVVLFYQDNILNNKHIGVFILPEQGIHFNIYLLIYLF